MKKEVGDVTVLVNNAGIVSGKKFFDIPDNMIDLSFKVNTLAHFWVNFPPLPPPTLQHCKPHHAFDFLLQTHPFSA